MTDASSRIGMSNGHRTMPRCYALVPCAGTGTRAGARGPKQYHPIGGLPMVAQTLRALTAVAALDGVLVVVDRNDRAFETAVPSHAGDGRWVVRCGGATRAQTVANGLVALAGLGAQPDDWVLVHDAARCLVEPAWVQRLIDACRDDPVGGLLALPLPDTLKQSSVDSRVAQTVPRGDKWLAQTPQMFRLGPLRAALARAAEATDEAGAMEAAGQAPRLVLGDPRNIKVTYPADFALAEALLGLRHRGETGGQTT